MIIEDVVEYGNNETYDGAYSEWYCLKSFGLENSWLKDFVGKKIRITIEEI